MFGGRLVLIPGAVSEPGPLANWFMEKALGPILKFAYCVVWPSAMIGVVLRGIGLV